MRATTATKYQRIQAAYRRLRHYDLSHDFCVDAISAFFGMSDEGSITKALRTSVEGYEKYPYQDLDNLWFDRLVDLHIDNKKQATKHEIS